MPRVAVMPCGLAEQAITVDSMAFRCCPKSGSLSVAREHSDILSRTDFPLLFRLNLGRLYCIDILELCPLWHAILQSYMV